MFISAPRRALTIFALAAAVLAGCDRSITAPDASPRPINAWSAIEGDTLSCRSGWVIIEGRYVCNEDL